jgi:drug/metabolite transporter (DMT)-like permease
MEHYVCGDAALCGDIRHGARLFAAAVSSSELPAATTSLGLLATPAISILVALLLLGERPTLILMSALALILAGMAVGISGPAADAPRR